MVRKINEFISKKDSTEIRRFIACLVLSLYLIMLFIFTGLATNTKQTFGFNLYLAVLGVIIGTIAVIFIPKYLKINFRLSQHNIITSYITGICVVIVTFVVYFIYQRGYFPGGLTPDSYLQYKMAMGDAPLKNWHPVLHTLIIYKLPIMLGRHLGMIIMLQIFYFSLAVGYVSYAMSRCRIPTIFILLYELYICTNPFLGTYMMYSWKDQAFMICGLILFGQYIRIVTTNGDWILLLRNRLFFSMIAVLCGYMRHNAILYVLPMVVILLFFGGGGKDRPQIIHCWTNRFLFFFGANTLYQS